MHTHTGSNPAWRDTVQHGAAASGPHSRVCLHCAVCLAHVDDEMPPLGTVDQPRCESAILSASVQCECRRHIVVVLAILVCRHRLLVFGLSCVRAPPTCHRRMLQQMLLEHVVLWCSMVNYGVPCCSMLHCSQVRRRRVVAAQKPVMSRLPHQSRYCHRYRTVHALRHGTDRARRRRRSSRRRWRRRTPRM